MRAIFKGSTLTKNAYVVLNQMYSTSLSNSILSERKHKTGDSGGRKYAIDVQHIAYHIYTNRKDLNNYFERGEFVQAVHLIMQATSGEDRCKFKNIYSFATKYCSWKDLGENVVPMYDSYLHGMLKAYYDANPQLGKLPKIVIEKEDKDGTNYNNYVQCIKEMMNIKCFSENNYSTKEVDSILWQIAKEKDGKFCKPW